MESAFEQLATLLIPDGALVVVTIAEGGDREFAEASAQGLCDMIAQCGRRAAVVVVASGTRIELLTDGKLARMGLMRIPTDGEPQAQGR